MFETGPKVGFMLNAKTVAKIDGETMKENIEKDNYNTIDLAIGVGTSYKITDNIGVSARYNFGISNLADGGGTLRNNVFQIGAFYAF